MHKTQDQIGHSILIVSRRTGLSPDVIRAWERRYRVVEPRRSESRRRLYSDEDVERLRLLRQATTAGRRISDVAELSTSALSALSREDHSFPAAFLAKSLEAVRRLDVATLKDCLLRASVELGVTELLEDVLVPFLEDIGTRWHRGDMRIYHEHLATTSVRALLDSLRASLPGRGDAPALIATTPVGQRHELGALTAALIAEAEGWRVHYYGPDMPAADIAGAAALHGASAVLLSITFTPSLSQTSGELRAILELLSPHVKLVVGGRASAELRPLLDRSGAIVPEGLAGLRDELRQLRTGTMTLGAT